MLNNRYSTIRNEIVLTFTDFYWSLTTIYKEAINAGFCIVETRKIKKPLDCIYHTYKSS